MKQQLESIEQKALAALEEAKESSELEALRVKFLGKKGELTAVLKKMGGLSPEERPVMGQMANQVRAAIEQSLEEKKTLLAAAAMDRKLRDEALDVTMPAKEVPLGHKHPMSIVLDEMKEIFIGMGFDVVEGPELESYNFTKLNTPAGHPARDRQDTFYTTEDDKVLLRTQTSPMQIRVMESRKPPIRIISPGRVYRKDEVDATHSPMFHQMEGLVIDKGITMADLKGSLIQMGKLLYGEDCVTRFRPHHFPFTEPSCEMDVQCFKCHGTGEVDGHTCPTCHGEGWIELLGAGMVHPWVLEGCGIDPNEYSGFAFGCGVERMTMNRFAINDLRLIFENDVRFLSQF
jgi:phenylalanyl-tRNA synthetase alpha chain